MILKSLSLTNYKNISVATLNFSQKLNCVIGANGMGKTNLLDSIYYLSFTRSHIYLPDNMIIQNGCDLSVLEAKYDMYDKEEHLFCGLQRGKSKILRRNKKEYTKVIDHIGLFPIVMISPADIELIRGGSIERRKFMDQLISQESNPYLTALVNYKELLEQRNSLLKQEYGIDLALLNIIEERMAKEALLILHFRKDWIERVSPLFLEYYQFISGGNDRVDLKYVPSIDVANESELLGAWKETLIKDKALGYTTLGPHKDDLDMLLSDSLIRKVGSQGQSKSYMVALKFAQFTLLSRLHKGNTPILLLDDVFDKLDEQRVDRIVQMVSSERFGQIFMTDTNRKYLDQILESLPSKSYALFTVIDGSFQALETR